MIFLSFASLRLCGYESSESRVFQGPRTLSQEQYKCDVLNETFRVKFDFSKLGIADEESKSYIIGTLDNIAKYFGRLIKCARFRDDYDLLIEVNSVKNLGAIASAAPYFYPNDPCHRPVSGIIYLDKDSIPYRAVPSDWNKDNGYFNTLLHEMFHVLGFSSDAMHPWINKTTGEYLDHSLKSIRTTVTAWNKNYTIVHSKACHEYAVKKWGKETFFDGRVPAGIELQEFKGNRRDLHHISMRIYQQDIMLGVKISNDMVTDASLTILQDTWWWDIDFSMAELNPFGNPFAVGDEPSAFSGFPDKAQIPYWPQHIQYKVSGYYCDPLYQGIQYITRNWINCDDPKRFYSYCNQKSYIDPEGYGAVDDIDANFVGYMRPAYHCVNQNVDPINGNGKNAFCAISNFPVITTRLLNESPMCFNMSCDDGTLRINVQDKSVACEYENQYVRIRGYRGYIRCPKPRHICYLINQQNKSIAPTESQGFTKSVGFTESQDFKKSIEFTKLSTASQEFYKK